MKGPHAKAQRRQEKSFPLCLGSLAWGFLFGFGAQPAIHANDELIFLLYLSWRLGALA